jgi:parallel beta-helix repeat protein
MAASGRIDHSVFSRNVFGAYTWEASNMRWTRNRFVDNIVYGFDPHDGSNWFVVDHNYAADNGRHGIIFSRLCKHDVVRDNVSVRNAWHGIVIDAGRAGRLAPSGDIQVYDNVVQNNGRVGISINGSNHNLIKHNRVSGGLIGIRVFGRSYGQADGNVIAGNQITGAREIGILIAKPATATRIVGDVVSGSIDAIAVHGARSTLVMYSKVAHARLHAVSIVDASDTRISHNSFSGGGPSVINRLRDTGSVERANDTRWNYPLLHDVARVMSWFIGPGLWALLFFVVLTSGLVVRVAEAATSRRSRKIQPAPPSAPSTRPNAPLRVGESADASSVRAVRSLPNPVSFGAGGKSQLVAASGLALLGTLVWRHRRAFATVSTTIVLLGRDLLH